MKMLIFRKWLKNLSLLIIFIFLEQQIGWADSLLSFYLRPAAMADRTQYTRDEIRFIVHELKNIFTGLVILESATPLFDIGDDEIQGFGKEFRQLFEQIRNMSGKNTQPAELRTVLRTIYHLLSSNRLAKIKYFVEENYNLAGMTARRKEVIIKELEIANIARWYAADLFGIEKTEIRQFDLVWMMDLVVFANSERGIKIEKEYSSNSAIISADEIALYKGARFEVEIPIHAHGLPFIPALKGESNLLQAYI